MTQPEARTVRVQRHPFDASKHEALFPEDCAELSELSSRAPKNLGEVAWTANLCEMVLERASVFDRKSPSLPLAARLLAQAKTALLLIRQSGTETATEFSWGDRRVSLTGVADESTSHVGAWTTGFYAALMSRDEQCKELLSTIEDEVLRRSSTQADECEYTWKAALIAFHQDASSAAPLVERALEASRPDRVRIAHPKAAAIRATAYSMLHALLQPSPTAFNDALSATLLAHKAFWGAADLATARRGWISQRSLALACLARDRGVAIVVDSEYLLPSLIEAAPRSLG